VIVGLAAALPEAGAAEASGPYLAARTAMRASDFREAARFFSQALVREPSNPGFLDGALMAQIGQGTVDLAVPVARRINALGGDGPAVTLVLVADRVARGDFAQILSDLADGHRVGPLPDALIEGWAEVGAGRMSDALAAFDRLAAAPGVGAFGVYHKALALALAGDFEGADAVLAADGRGFTGTRRGAIAHALILAQIDRFEDAAAALSAVFGDAADPEVDALRTALADRRAPPFEIVRSPADGFAEAFYSLAAALEGEASNQQTLLYVRLAQFLRPDHADAHLLAGSVLSAMGQHDLAIESYRRIPVAHPARFNGELARAQALAAADRLDEATAVLRGLSTAHGGYVQVHSALGDMLRRQKDFAAAAEAYSRAISLIGTPEPRHWALFYSRAIAYERARDWDRAEPDFRKALELNPDHPQVLNYLGYSLLELNRNLPEAMAMIERAVAQAPDEGHIVDSLAWGLFLLGRFEEAVEPMERASLLLPVDPIVTDHLGDVYWAVGRQTEARFQWRRALSFAPEEDLAARIRLKLEKGLDAVLAMEGATPLVARGQ
jgi:tetratricopeptide (TPR) repeat protein